MVNSEKNKTDAEKGKLKILLILLCVLFAINMIFYLFYMDLVKLPHFERSAENLVEPEEDLLDLSEIFSVKDFVEVEVEIDESFIFLRDKKNRCRGMVVAIDPSQAYSIEQGLELKVGIRPMSHDVIRDILEQYEIDVMMMKITEQRGGTYFGRLILENEDKILNLDVRPSDGIAIAVRTQAPIYLSNSLLEDIDENFC